MLDDRNGEFIIKSLHFPINVFDIVNRLKQGHKCIIDVNTSTIRFKRTLSNSDFCDYPATHIQELCEDSDSNEVLDDQDDQNNIDSEHQLLSVMKDAFEVIKQTGRGHDFLSLMK